MPRAHLRAGEGAIAADLTFLFQRNFGSKVVEISTGDPVFHTNKGIHVGSSIAALKRAYPTIRYSAIQNSYDLYKISRDGIASAGARWTAFTPYQGKVDSIDIMLHP